MFLASYLYLHNLKTINKRNTKYKTLKTKSLYMFTYFSKCGKEVCFDGVIHISLWKPFTQLNFNSRLIIQRYFIFPYFASVSTKKYFPKHAFHISKAAQNKQYKLRFSLPWMEGSDTSALSEPSCISLWGDVPLSFSLPSFLIIPTFSHLNKLMFFSMQ